MNSTGHKEHGVQVRLSINDGNVHLPLPLTQRSPPKKPSLLHSLCLNRSLSKQIVEHEEGREAEREPTGRGSVVFSAASAQARQGLEARGRAGALGGRPDGPVELRPRSLFQGSRLHSDDVSGERGVRSDGSGGGRSRDRRGGFASPRSSLGVFCSADP